jgi:high frequency lysogenization protein
MSQHTLIERTLALAGIFQAAIVVNQIATKGSADAHDLETCINSLLITDPKNTIEVYGSIDNLRTGLFGLMEHLDNSARQKPMEVARYVITMIHLQRKLMKRRDLLDILDKGIERAKQQAELYSPLHENVIANLADIYSNTISQIPPKIMVSGEGNFLNNPANANKIRALLLAGVRSAVLWSQTGGGRWQVIFKRKQFVQTARDLLEGNRDEF